MSTRTKYFASSGNEGGPRKNLDTNFESCHVNLVQKRRAAPQEERTLLGVESIDRNTFKVCSAAANGEAEAVDENVSVNLDCRVD